VAKAVGDPRGNVVAGVAELAAEHEQSVAEDHFKVQESDFMRVQVKYFFNFVNCSDFFGK
jgi:hypothetical protein